MEEDTRGIVHDFKGFAQDEEVAEFTRAVAEVANNLKLAVGEGKNNCGDEGSDTDDPNSA